MANRKCMCLLDVYGYFWKLYKVSKADYVYPDAESEAKSKWYFKNTSSCGMQDKRLSYRSFSALSEQYIFRN